MAAKKRSTDADKELKKTVKKLRSQLDRADAKADKWKKKAGKLEKSAAQSEAQVKKLTKRLEKANDKSRRSSAGDTSSPTAAAIPAVADPADVPEAIDTEVLGTDGPVGPSAGKQPAGGSLVAQAGVAVTGGNELAGQRGEGFG